MHTVKKWFKKVKNVIFLKLTAIVWMNVCLDTLPRGKSIQLTRFAGRFEINNILKL